MGIKFSKCTSCTRDSAENDFPDESKDITARKENVELIGKCSQNSPGSDSESVLSTISPTKEREISNRTDCNICSDLTDKLHMDIFQVAAELIGSWPELQSFICKGDIQTLDDYVKENKIDLKTVRFDNKLYTPLHLAVKADIVGMVEYMVEEGININARDEDGSTALGLAYENENTSQQIIKFLVNAKANEFAKSPFSPYALSSVATSSVGSSGNRKMNWAHSMVMEQLRLQQMHQQKQRNQRLLQLQPKQKQLLLRKSSKESLDEHVSITSDDSSNKETISTRNRSNSSDIDHDKHRQLLINGRMRSLSLNSATFASMSMLNKTASTTAMVAALARPISMSASSCKEPSSSIKQQLQQQQQQRQCAPLLPRYHSAYDYSYSEPSYCNANTTTTTSAADGAQSYICTDGIASTTSCDTDILKTMPPTGTQLYSDVKCEPTIEILSTVTALPHNNFNSNAVTEYETNAQNDHDNSIDTSRISSTTSSTSSSLQPHKPLGRRLRKAASRAVQSLLGSRRTGEAASTTTQPIISLSGLLPPRAPRPTSSGGSSSNGGTLADSRTSSSNTTAFESISTSSVPGGISSEITEEELLELTSVNAH